MLVLGSFSSARLPVDFSWSTVTTGNYTRVYTNPLTYRVLANSLIYVAGTLAAGITMSLGFAWLVARTNMPAKWLAVAGIPLGLIVPSMLESMSWVLLFSPRIGYVNGFFKYLFGLQQPVFNVYTLPGMIALESLRMVPTGFLMMLPLLLRLDPSTEEAASMSGAPFGRIIGRVTLPLLLPGLLAVMLYQGITVLASFEVPGIIGLPGQVYVFSTLIYTYTSASSSAGGSDFGSAAALAMLYLAINVMGLWLYARVTRNAARFAVIGGKSYRPRLMDLGAWRFLALGAIGLYMFISVVLPVLVLLWTSLTPRIVQPGLAALGNVTGAEWARIPGNSELNRVLVNTVIAVILAATFTVLASLVVGWISQRTAFRARRLLDQLSFMSHGLPGVILGLALIWFWVRLSAPVYGTLAIIVIALCTGFLAYGTRSIGAALFQLRRELEEAAYASGAGPSATVRRVVTPLLMPALISLWLWAALQALRIVTLPLMLQTGPENTVLAVYLWNYWDKGEINLVAAVGTAMVAVMFVVTILLSRFGLLSRRSTLI